MLEGTDCVFGQTCTIGWTNQFLVDGQAVHTSIGRGPLNANATASEVPRRAPTTQYHNTISQHNILSPTPSRMMVLVLVRRLLC